LERWKKSNPRFVGRINLTPDTQDCVNSIKSAVRELPPKPPYRFRANETHQTRKKGAELEFKIDEPRLTCRVDFYDGANLIEYKTGTPKEEHVSQLQLYAAIIRESEGVAPSQLTLHYVSTNTKVSVSHSGADILAECRIKLAEWDKDFEEESWTADVQENCRYCLVRQLCDDYWSTLPNLGIDLVEDRFTDIEFEVNGEVASLRDGFSVFPIKLRDGSEGLIYLTGQSHLDFGCRVRALNIRVKSSRSPPDLTVSSTSEIFFDSVETNERS
jgi:hypothetical protein